MREYLASGRIIATRSLEAAREAVTRIYLRHDLAGPDGAMNMRLNAMKSRHMTFGYLTYQADAELTMPPTEDCYIVNLTLGGRTLASRRDGAHEHTGNERGVVLLPHIAHRVRWSDLATSIRYGHLHFGLSAAYEMTTQVTHRMRPILPATNGLSVPAAALMALLNRWADIDHAQCSCRAARRSKRGVEHRRLRALRTRRIHRYDTGVSSTPGARR